MHSDHLQGTASGACAHSVNLSCTLDHKRGGKDWVLDWGKEIPGVKQSVEQHPPLAHVECYEPRLTKNSQLAVLTDSPPQRPAIQIA